jgi:hypothetical protein
MEIQSFITLNKDITIETEDKGMLYLAFISVQINRDNGQCQMNLQILDKENYSAYNYYIYTELRSFMENLGAYSQGCMLELLCGILPSNEEINQEAIQYLKLEQ